VPSLFLDYYVPQMTLTDYISVISATADCEAGDSEAC
jgi:hypothetical protein